MKTETPQAIYLKDYKKPDYKILTVDLTFDLHETQTQVTSELSFVLDNEENKTPSELFLNGENLILKSIELNGEELAENQNYRLSAEGLTILNPPAEFKLVIKNEINPTANTALDGLYRAKEIFCTQNEPQGFRRITYYLDRPDVLAVFRTKVIGDKKKYPFLLSNGNPLEKGDLDDGRHWVLWEDPFPKPSYLYALVAGDFDLLEDEYTTMSGRKVSLQIYCDKGHVPQCSHAMESLKKSMQWDEQRFGLEYDLDIYMIVAVGSFNMGAMENKGLNIFNSALVMADQETATDDDFLAIEGVIGHEYFHNWTGNRITCRDWFQLTLKEGLTVFRDQEFSSDMNSRAVQRIADVRKLRDHQFVEDAGPNSHPIKPDSYIEINNFYTATIYEKGAEVIRMIHTLLGEKGFRKGMDKYFELYDGQAVTTEDFLHAMSVANGDFDFSQFKNWYAQSGTPHVKVETNYDESSQSYTVKLQQSCPATAGQDKKENFVIPLRFGLIDESGEDLSLDKDVLLLKGKEQTFTFNSIGKRPILSLNREFSAPITLDVDERAEDFAFKMSHDSDPFNRYEAAQKLAQTTIMDLMQDARDGKTLQLSPIFLEAFGKVLKNETLDCSIKNMTLSMPSEISLHALQDTIDFKLTHQIREFVKKTLVAEYKDSMLSLYQQLNEQKEYDLSPESMGSRSLRNHLMAFLVLLEEDWSKQLVYDQYLQANNMTDKYTALVNIIHHPNKYTDECVQNFYDRWKEDDLVMQKWLVAQASAPLENTLDKVKELENAIFYDETIPNFVRALIGVFGRNYLGLHHESGRGYQFMADKILKMNQINPQVAARLVGQFNDYKHLDDHLKPLLKKELGRILDSDGLSKNVYEIASKIYKQ